MCQVKEALCFVKNVFKGPRIDTVYHPAFAFALTLVSFRKVPSWHKVPTDCRSSQAHSSPRKGGQCWVKPVIFLHFVRGHRCRKALQTRTGCSVPSRVYLVREGLRRTAGMRSFTLLLAGLISLHRNPEV